MAIMVMLDWLVPTRLSHNNKQTGGWKARGEQHSRLRRCEADSVHCSFRATTALPCWPRSTRSCFKSTWPAMSSNPEVREPNAPGSPSGHVRGVDMVWLESHSSLI